MEGDIPIHFRMLPNQKDFSGGRWFLTANLQLTGVVEHAGGGDTVILLETVTGARLPPHPPRGPSPLLLLLDGVEFSQAELDRVPCSVLVSANLCVPDLCEPTIAAFIQSSMQRRSFSAKAFSGVLC
jgi:hypothetical protein